MRVVVVREISPVIGAGHKNGPEGSSILTSSQPCKVDMVEESACLKFLPEAFSVDMVVQENTDQDGKVIVPVWRTTQSDLGDVRSVNMFPGCIAYLSGESVRVFAPRDPLSGGST